MSVYPIDILREREGWLEEQISRCSGFGYHDQKREDDLSNELIEVLKQIEYLKEKEAKPIAMTVVVNKKTHTKTPNDVYIGRPSKYGNPFTMGKDGSREEVVEKYAAWILQQPELLANLPSLRGKNLVCWCAPAMCHGDVLKILCEEIL